MKKSGRFWIAAVALCVMMGGVGCGWVGQPSREDIPPESRGGAPATGTVSSVEPLTAPRPDVGIPVPHITQEGYPTGCESACAVMLLRYYGVDMDMDTFIDDHLDCGGCWYEDGQLVAPHPAECFVGDPRTEWGFGCFAPVICRALNRCLPEGRTATDKTGTDLSALCRDYVGKGDPVAIWATIDMKPVQDGAIFLVAGSGETFVWPAGEHCLLLVGYDEERYYFNDPLKETAPVAYDRETVERRWAELGRQAVAIERKTT